MNFRCEICNRPTNLTWDERKHGGENRPEKQAIWKCCLACQIRAKKINAYYTRVEKVVENAEDIFRKANSWRD